MTPEEINAHARRIISDLAANVSYTWVYEEDELDGADEDEMLAVHAAVRRARVTAEWDD